MKGLFYYRVNKDNKANSGVIKKAYGQAAAFRRLGVEVDLVLLSDSGILLNDKLIYTFKKPVLTKRRSTYWFYFFNLLPILFKIINFKKYDFLYFRYALAHPGLIQLLKKVHIRNPNIKVIAEMPTFPYDKEKTTIIDRLSLQMDKFNRIFITKYLHSFTHYGLDESIFGVRTIPIRNGITLDKIQISNSKPQKNKVRLIGVANWSYWHGLDRLIEGIRNYYSDGNYTYDFTLTVIGQGNVTEKHKHLVRKYQLQNRVKFVPPMTGKELDDFFDDADIGVGTLGLHRKGLELDSSLKHREYCARGLPFLMAGKDLDFPKEISFVFSCPANEEPIDIRRVIEFYEKIKMSRTKIRLNIRKYAENNLSWYIKMKVVKDFLRSYSSKL